MFSFFALPRVSQGDSPPTASRLDRIYVSDHLKYRIIDALYTSASRELIDHDLAPSCVLQCNAPNLAPRPWRLPYSLLLRPFTTQLISSACQSLPSEFNGLSWDAWKLALCNQLKAFGRQEKIRIKKTSDHLQNLVSHLRIARAVNPTDDGLTEQLRIVSQQFDQYEASRAADIALKAKLKVEGPRKMGISSLLAGLNSHVKASLVNSLQAPSGETISDLPAMSALCTSFFQDLYIASHPVHPDDSFWSHVPPPHIPLHITARLALPFSMEEISSAITKLPRGKTPGPDGLPRELFSTFRANFTQAIHALFLASSSSLPPTMLQGRTVLIPKKGDSTVLDNLRPITLMNSDYKILAIRLASRLQPLLPSLIHHSQAAFIKSRKIGDTLNDTLDIFYWAATQHIPLLALTVEIRKAYDLVDREFMLSCLALLGLRPVFLNWRRLMACYADDVTIFLNSDKELQMASHVLLSFAAVSGEYPNWAM
ncbi:unnamed protein product [Closterium sp. NIES-65]|nr:unnamed protein product [Closterium sp. NIES-65]